MIGYYVTVKDGPRTGFLLGPYDTHAEALAQLNRGTADMIMKTREEVVAVMAAKMTLETSANPRYALEFCKEFVRAIERADSKPLTADDLKAIRP